MKAFYVSCDRALVTFLVKKSFRGSYLGEQQHFLGHGWKQCHSVFWQQNITKPCSNPTAKIVFYCFLRRLFLKASKSSHSKLPK